MRAKEFQPLLEYLKGTKKTKNPIFNIGFDTRLSGADTAKDLVVEMERFLNGGKKKYLDQETMDYLKSELGEDKGYYNILRSPERTEKMMKQFAEILTILSKNKKKLKKEYGKFAYKYFYLTIKAAHQGFSAYHMYGTGFEHFEESWNARDKSMAENISYIANELYPDEKIIIWAHSYHNANDGGQLENLQGVKEYEELITMGTHLYDEFGDDLYSIAFVSYDGAITSNGFKINIPLEDPPQGSLSWLFHEIGWKYGYLDLKHPPGRPLAEK